MTRRSRIFIWMGCSLWLIDTARATPGNGNGPPDGQANGRCALSRPDPAVDGDAAGMLKLELIEGRSVIKVHLRKLDGREVYTLMIMGPDGESATLGMITTNPAGN